MTVWPWARPAAATWVVGVAGITLLGALPALPASADPLTDPLRASHAQKRVITTTEDLHTAQGLTPELLSHMRNQEALDVLADDIRANAGQPGPSGISGIVVEPERNALRLYWHGVIPAEVERKISAARGRGMAVETHSAPYTEAQLRAEVDRISKLRLSSGAVTSQRAMTVVPRSDATGITVGLSGLPAGTTPEQARRLVPALDSEIPLTINVGVSVTPAVRWIDPPAHWGGAFMQRWVDERPGDACSNAFGVTGNNGRATYLLTAAHCGEGEWRTGELEFSDGSTARFTLGSTIPVRDLNRDGQAIHTPGGSDSVVYHGRSINPDIGDTGTHLGLRVGGASGNNIGDLVCTSGAFTGTVCGVRVTGIGPIAFDPPLNGVGRMTGMINIQLPGVAVAGNGDSGGPVYSISPNNDPAQTRAIARGVISAMDTGPAYERPCQGWAPPGRVCSMSVWIGDVQGIMGTIGVRLNTG